MMRKIASGTDANSGSDWTLYSRFQPSPLAGLGIGPYARRPILVTRQNNQAPSAAQESGMPTLSSGFGMNDPCSPAPSSPAQESAQGTSQPGIKGLTRAILQRLQDAAALRPPVLREPNADLATALYK